MTLSATKLRAIVNLLSDPGSAANAAGILAKEAQARGLLVADLIAQTTASTRAYSPPPPPPPFRRQTAVAEYLSVLDDAAFGGATSAEPKAISPVDPAARYTAAANSAAVYAYSDNYLVDLKHAVIMDVEATTAIRQAEVGAAKGDARPHRRAVLRRPAFAPGRRRAGYGSAEMLRLAGG